MKIASVGLKWQRRLLSNIILPFHTLVSSYPLPEGNYHTNTQIRQCYFLHTDGGQKMPQSFCLLHWIWPHLTRLLLRGKPIFCYYFSCVWCKIAHYIFRTELFCLVNWKGKVITPWIYTASSFVVLKMDLIKQNNTHSRDVLILMEDGNK